MLKVPKMTGLHHIKENAKGEVDFLPTDKYERFVQIDTIILGVWPGMPNLSKVTSLQHLCKCLKENVKNEIDFLPADKYQRFLLIDTFILGVCDKACPDYPK